MLDKHGVESWIHAWNLAEHGNIPAWLWIFR
jgi:hypothetical protein